MHSRTGSHSVFSVRLHFVFVTYYRRKVLTPLMLEKLEEMLRKTSCKLDCELLEFSGKKDHVYILLDFHPKHSISGVVACLKSSTARVMNQQFFDQPTEPYENRLPFWSQSYYVASSSGAKIEKLKEYINN